MWRLDPFARCSDVADPMVPEYRPELPMIERTSVAPPAMVLEVPG